VGWWLGDGVPQADALVELSAAAVTAASTTTVALIRIKPSFTPFQSGLHDARRPDSIQQWLNSPIPTRVAESGLVWRHAQSLQNTRSAPTHAAAPMA
jgi:hypothetical protein